MSLNNKSPNLYICIDTCVQRRWIKYIVGYTTSSQRLLYYIYRQYYIDTMLILAWMPNLLAFPKECENLHLHVFVAEHAIPTNIYTLISTSSCEVIRGSCTYLQGRPRGFCIQGMLSRPLLFFIYDRIETNFIRYFLDSEIMQA